MEKRRLISLRSVLLQYLVRTALACLLVAVGWLLVLLLWIQNSGLFLPANQAAYCFSIWIIFVDNSLLV